MKRGRVVIFGGTFNPPHAAHLVVAAEVADRLEHTPVVFVPSAVPPHKVVEAAAPAEHRLRMVELAVGADERFAVSTVEIDRGGPSYSLDTVKSIGAGPDETFFVVGSDAVAEMDDWHRIDELRRLCRFVVLARPGVDYDGLPARHLERAQRLDVPRLDISSTDIRRRLAEGRSISYMVPRAVEEYIYAEGLYGARRGT